MHNNNKYQKYLSSSYYKNIYCRFKQWWGERLEPTLSLFKSTIYVLVVWTRYIFLIFFVVVHNMLLLWYVERDYRTVRVRSFNLKTDQTWSVYVLHQKHAILVINILRAYSKFSVINCIEINNCGVFSTIPLGIFGILRFRINIWHFIQAFR